MAFLSSYTANTRRGGWAQSLLPTSTSTSTSTKPKPSRKPRRRTTLKNFLFANLFTIGLSISLIFFIAVFFRYGVPNPLSSHAKRRHYRPRKPVNRKPILSDSGNEWDTNDPGWKLTVDQYYEAQSRNILDTIVEALSKPRTVKVSDVSLGASEQDIKEFFSFSGDIEYVEMQSGNERSQVAFVTFKDSQGADTALLLSGATIVDMSVTIAPAPDYQLPPAASAPPAENKVAGGAESAVQKAEEVVSTMLARGFILGKDAVNKAKAFDEKIQFTSTATAQVVSLDKKIGLTEKISMGTTAVNDKVKEIDQKFQVSEKTKSALVAAEQKVSNAGSAIMKNRYVFTWASWVTGAFNKVAKAAGEVGQKAKEKAGMAEDEQRREMVDDYAKLHLSESPKAEEEPHTNTKPPPAQGLIL